MTLRTCRRAFVNRGKPPTGPYPPGREREYARWKKAVSRSMDWVD